MHDMKSCPPSPSSYLPPSPQVVRKTSGPSRSTSRVPGPANLSSEKVKFAFLRMKYLQLDWDSNPRLPHPRAFLVCPFPFAPMTTLPTRVALKCHCGEAVTSNDSSMDKTPSWQMLLYVQLRIVCCDINSDSLCHT